MIDLASESSCTGCMACVQRCPRQCIKIMTDETGHLYPKIDVENCISCHSCQYSCPTLHTVSFYDPKTAYAVWSLNTNCRKASASGGAAAEFYQNALENEFWICGAEYADQFHVTHTLTKDVAKIEAFQQSKYVYSETGDIYQRIEQRLDEGDKVLFISLPCKVAGLLSFLRKEYHNLITVDIVCHGTPSYKTLRHHIEICQGNDNATKLKFRQDNEFQFDLFNEEKSIYHKIGRQDTYLAAFLEGLNYRESCYQCPYARSKRVGDLTIGDFWGIGKEIPFEHPYSGSISAVLINTDKGKAFFAECGERMFVEERPVSEVIQGNAQLKAPTPVHPKRSEFEQLCVTFGFEEAVKVCLKKEIAEDKRQLNKRMARQHLRKFAGLFFKKYRG